MNPLVASLAFILAATPLAAKQPSSRLLDHLVVTDATHPDLALREISALARDGQAWRLLAAMTSITCLWEPTPTGSRLPLLRNTVWPTGLVRACAGVTSAPKVWPRPNRARA